MTSDFTLAGLIGYPVAHSLSPLIHRHWIEEAGLAADYIAIPSAPHVFAKALDALRSAGFAGVNVTLPLKQSAYAVASAADEAAQATRAANLLLFEDSHIVARNTDVEGLRSSLQQEVGAAAVAGQKVLVLGAGGAARAAAIALDRSGAESVQVFSRTKEQAERMVKDLEPSLGSRLTPRLWSEWSAEAPEASLLVNATSGGMLRKDALELHLDHLAPHAAVYDLVYNPLETDLVREARARGHTAVNGLGMLMWQAVPAFEAFYGVSPTVTHQLRCKLEEALGG